MKTIRVLLLMAFGWLAMPASGWAFYNPSTGRWLSRDPVGESGFDVVRGIKRRDTKQSERKILRKPEVPLFNCEYSLNGNDGLNKVDFLGLTVYGSSCSEEQRTQFADSMNKMCNLALASKLGCCKFNTDLQKNLRKICSGDFKMVIICLEPNNENCRTGMCAGVDKDAEFAKDGDGIISFCPSAWGKSPCDTTFDCVVLHELLHGGGLKGDPNSDIQRVEKCAGCKESYKGKM